jgi:hypothetical protein
MRLNKTQIGLLVALLVGNAIILFDNAIFEPLRFPAALALTFMLSGWAWLPAFHWLHTDRGLERLILIPGVSSLLASLALLIALLLPGPFTETPVIIALNLITLTGLSLQVIRNSAGSLQPSAWQWPSRKVLLILLAIIAMAAITRFTRLGYAEFHEDELENMRLIVRAFKGEEYAPFLDSKGPIHWILPAALWYLNGWLNETIARTPMALTSLLLIPMMYVLGRRLSGGRDSVGLLAAGFVALNGFYVALARHVENRALIVFWGALAIWFIYRYYREKLDDLLPGATLTSAIGLIAHPTFIFYFPAMFYIIWLRIKEKQSRQVWIWLAVSAGLFGLTVALFYVPYLTNPQIGLVYQYFAEERVGTALLYNRIDSFLGESELYSSLYYGPILVVLTLWLLSRYFSRLGYKGMLLFGGLLAAMVSTSAWPEIWQGEFINLAFIPFAAATLILLALPHPTPEIKLLLLWFAVPFGGLLFLAKDASNHIQIAFTGLTFLAVFGLVDMWHSARLRPRLKIGLAAALGLAGLLIFSYQLLSFDAPVTTYWNVKIDFTNNPHSIYKYLYRSIPRPRKIISNPRLGGWKTVGYLHETGALGGDFRSVNESFAVPIWYTFQTPRSCYEDPQNYWLRRDWQGWPEDEQKVIEQGYTLTRVVQVDNQPKLHLYEKNVPPQTPAILNLADYRTKFDRLATPARFAQAEPINHPASLNFGDRLLLRGYNLPDIDAVQPGDLLPVTVYWGALTSMETRYRSFVHLIDPNGNRWSQHDDDPACRLLTTDMQPGQESAREFRLPIAADTPPGEYQIVLGLYHPDTLARLEIWDNQSAQNIGDSVTLGTVTVVNKQ